MIYNFITIGSATRDVSLFTAAGVLLDNKKDILRQELLAFEYGAKVKVDKFNYTFGGGGANSAVNFVNLGFKTACLSVVGNDNNGREILKNLNKRGIKLNLMKKMRNQASSFSFILITPTGERVIFSNRGVNQKLVINKRDLRTLQRTSGIYLTSLSGQWRSNLKKIFSVTGPKIYWNPNAAQYSAGVKQIGQFLKKTEVLFLNKDEAIELVMSVDDYRDKDNKFLNNVRNLLKVLKAQGPNMIVITSGKKGADVYDGRKFYHRNILPEKKRVDTTGIGDCFNSTFTAGLELFNHDINKAMTLALKNTAAKVSHLGAQNGLIKLKK